MEMQPTNQFVFLGDKISIRNIMICQLNYKAFDKILLLKLIASSIYWTCTWLVQKCLSEVFVGDY